MGVLASAVDWWEEWQLRVLVLSSLAIQFLLFVFSFLRKYAIPGLVRFMMWLAYLAGDAVAIYALATLFNRHKTDDEHRGSTLEVVWAPVILLHLGGHDGFTAYNIEDNELWSRHLLTAVSQVTVAIYVFCKSWPPGGDDKRLLQAAILLFVPGVLKCFVKPWALKRASIYSLVSSPAASVKQNGGEVFLLEDYVKRAKDCQDEAQVARASVDGEDNKEPGGGMAIGTLIGEFRKAVREAWIRRDPEMMSRQESSNNDPVREMLQGRSEAAKLFVDLSSSYPRRLSILEDFWGLREERAYGRVRQGLATAFLLLYTKLKTAASFANVELEDYGKSGRWSSLKYHLRMLILLSRTVLPWASIGLFHHCHRETYNGIDVKITYAMICSTLVLEAYSSFSLALTGETSEVWPEMVAQYSFIGYFARTMKHSKMMWIVSLLGCNDFLDQHWCMKPCFSSARISQLVLRYLKGGWKEKIHDAASYRRFNNHRSSEGLSLLSTKREKKPLLFDESVLLWHIATEFCFFSSSVSKHSKECAFAKVPMCRERFPSLASYSRQGRRWLFHGIISPSLQEKLQLIIHGIIQRIKERVPKCSICRTSSTGKNDQPTSGCDQDFTCCKAVLCRQMSNYMAYLLFVNPEMLLPGCRRNLFTAAHEELHDLFKSDIQAPLPLDNMRELTEKIIRKLNSSSEAGTETESERSSQEESSMEGSNRDKNFIHQAWDLAQELLKKDEMERWKEIQDVWVEMLCFSASRCRGYLHAKALGKGGEFLSYVWLLLFHMGMETFTDKLQRENEPPSHEAAGSKDKDTAETAREVTTTTSGMDRLQREHLPNQGAYQYGTASTSEIREVADDVV